MDLVIDANILFSILIKSGKTEELLFKEDIHLFAPEFIFEEFEKYKNLIVPRVLLSGDHKAVSEWRERQAVEITKKSRPDLIKKG